MFRLAVSALAFRISKESLRVARSQPLLASTYSRGALAVGRLAPRARYHDATAGSSGVAAIVQNNMRGLLGCYLLGTFAFGTYLDMRFEPRQKEHIAALIKIIHSSEPDIKAILAETKAVLVADLQAVGIKLDKLIEQLDLPQHTED